ncbi:hypothetical protein [Hydrogenophaga intermedia]|uniref:hypothetical protein n=1 Tax=Hydrogenophaga intermedia TaxID=65786 RepID=UPI002043BAEF|nr:hypothetical protein [Hydrogenophaga intermedia]MCM3565943.1 hypothetical protein [Hydrogenophaga intermedia]
MKAAEWIDRVKAAHGWESDYRVAKELGFRPNTISQYRAHGTTLDDAIAIKVAAALGEAPELVLIDQAAERSKSEAARSALSAALRRLGGVAASILLATGMAPNVSNGAGPAHAGQVQTPYTS